MQRYSVNKARFVDNPDLAEGVQEAVYSFSHKPHSPAQTHVILGILKLPTQQYLVNEIDPLAQNELRAAAHTIRNLGLPERTPIYDGASIGPLTAPQADSVIRIAQLVSAADHFMAEANGYREEAKTTIPSAAPHFEAMRAASAALSETFHVAADEESARFRQMIPTASTPGPVPAPAPSSAPAG
jgi:hypothetical protein